MTSNNNNNNRPISELWKYAQHLKTSNDAILSNFNYCKYLQDFKSLIYSSPNIKTKNKTPKKDLLEYYISTLENFIQIKKQINENNKKIEVKIKDIDRQFVEKINEFSKELKDFSIKSRKTYKEMEVNITESIQSISKNNNDSLLFNQKEFSFKLKQLDDYLILFYDNCKDIIKKIKEIHKPSQKELSQNYTIYKKIKTFDYKYVGMRTNKSTEKSMNILKYLHTMPMKNEKKNYTLKIVKQQKVMIYIIKTQIQIQILKI